MDATRPTRVRYLILLMLFVVTTINYEIGRASCRERV